MSAATDKFMQRLKGQNVVQWGTGQLADTPVNEDEPDSWEDANLVGESDVHRQIHDQGDPPPNILTPFQKKVMAVYAQPSDVLMTYTYSLTGAGQPIMIANQQDPGVACQVTICNYGDGAGAGDILIAPQSEFLSPSATGLNQPMAFRIEGPGVGVQALPFQLTTRSPLWAICVNDVTAYVGVIIETYSPDNYTWERWEVGQQ